MPAQWTGELVGKMHNNRVSSQELAVKIGCSTKWLSMVLNGHCSPKGAEQRFNAALDELISERGEDNAERKGELQGQPRSSHDEVSGQRGTNIK